jgi:hypothetical protein
VFDDLIFEQIVGLQLLQSHLESVITVLALLNFETDYPE